MGVKAGSAIRARQREVSERIERLMAQAGERTPMDPNGASKIRAAVGAGRRALRARDRATRAVSEAEGVLAASLAVAIDAGMSLTAACEAFGLSTSVGRRLYAAETPQGAGPPPRHPQDPGLA
jgi:hypothetical protein